MQLHKSLTPARLMEACEREMNSLDNPGFCVACGAEAGTCEPDARRYLCEECGEHQVYGAQELLFMVI